jgi:proliferating cell nuclear antigen
MVLILELKTTQTPAIKVLTDTLNSLLTDVNFVFHPKVIEPENENTPVQTGGLIIKEINKTGTILVYVRLDADKFDTYNYNYHKNKITVGINLNNLLKCLKCMSNYDAMTWAIDSDDINKLIIILESSERKEKKTFKLNLMDLEEEKYEVEPIDFPYSITLPSQDFHKYCKDMFSATEKMEIICTSNKVMFSGNGELGQIDFEVAESNGGLTIETNHNCYDEIVQGLFELRFLIIFTKCTNLCNAVTLYLKNDYPLIVKYTIAALGEIKLVLSPSKADDKY